MIRAALADVPYTFVRRLSPTEIELAYGAGTRDAVHERWRLVSRPNIAGCGNMVIVYKRRGYRFAGQISGTCAHA